MQISRFLLLVLLLAFAREAAGQYVIGYMPSWQGSADDIQYTKLTHINYAFLLPSPAGDGSLKALENPAKLERIVDQAHACGVKVGIAVGGWNDLKNAGFEGLSAVAANRETFVKNLLELLDAYDLDGVDIDWEYPKGGLQSQHYLLLMQLLAEKLHKERKFLSAAVADDEENGGAIPSKVFDVVDFLNIMAYDGNTRDGHSPYSLAESALDYWLGRGLPQSKAVLGVPFYARPSMKTFKALVAKGANPRADRFKGDSYNGIETIARKTQLAADRANGIMIWELSGDAPGANSLLSVISENLED